MAKYLWVGMDTTGISSDPDRIDRGDHIDQYLWNKPGNWKIFTNLNGSQKWSPTYDYPKPGDIVIVGDDRTSSGAIIAGWEPARSPLLFGGYTGSVGLGSWEISGLLGNSYAGTSYNSSIESFIFDDGHSIGLVGQSGPTDSNRVNAYNFPYLGGGLTGEILLWASYRDGLPTFIYTSDYTSSGKDPSEGLKLKVKTTVDLKVYRSSDQYETALVNPSQINVDNRMIIDLNFVKSITPGSPSLPQFPHNVGTSLRYNDYPGALTRSNRFVYPRLSGLKINGGSFLSMDIQPLSSVVLSPTGVTPYNELGDYGVLVKNAYVATVRCQKKQFMFFQGCTLGSMTVHQYGWNTVGGPDSVQHETDIPIEVDSNFSITQVLMDALGATAASSIPSGLSSQITLTAEPVRFTRDYTIPITSANTITSVVQSPTEIAPSLRQRVILGNRNSTVIRSIPKISIQKPTGGYHYMPWAVEFVGGITAATVDNSAGYLYSHRDMSVQNYIGINQINLAQYGTIDFSRNQQDFDDWRIGGISGGSVVGGIQFIDETGVIKGSAGVRLFNTQVENKIVDKRGGSVVSDVGSLLGFESLA